jgi:hypothetical protein
MRQVSGTQLWQVGCRVGQNRIYTPYMTVYSVTVGDDDKRKKKANS